MEQVHTGMGIMDHSRTETLRVIIEPGQTFFLPREITSLWVESGTVWLTAGGEDVIIDEGEFVVPHPDQSGAVVSTLGRDLARIKLSTTRRDGTRRTREQSFALTSNRT